MCSIENDAKGLRLMGSNKQWGFRTIKIKQARRNWGPEAFPSFLLNSIFYELKEIVLTLLT